MPNGIAHSEETKAAVMAALLAGQSVAQAAAAYNIKVSTVKGWSASLRREMRGGAVGGQRERIGDLVLGNLEALLTAVQEIVTRVSQDEGWIKRQPASELAVFVGVLSDKAYRILEALPDSAESDPVLAGGETESEAAGG